MKQCPNCRQTFTDDNSFCLMDGTTLVVMSGTQETLPAFSTGNDAPTQFISNPQPTSANISSGIPGWLYLLIGAMGMALIALVVFIFLMPNKGNNEVVSANVNNSNGVTKKAEKPAAENEPKETKQSSDDATFKKEPVTITKPPKFDSSISPAGSWSGNWSSKSAAYTATAAFEENNGNISGQINWTLQRATKKKDKVGSSAVEYVRGTFNRQTGKITLRGYRKDDPMDIVILDRYNLSLTGDGNQMSGKSINGNFVLRR